MMSFTWMAWTWPTAIFFIAIGIALVAMTLLELKRPTVMQRGFLPMATSRGDRFFISLLSAAFINLLWLAVFGSGSIALASVVAVVWACALLRWG